MLSRKRDYRLLTIDELFIIKRRLEKTKNLNEKELEELRRVSNELGRRIYLDD